MMSLGIFLFTFLIFSKGGLHLASSESQSHLSCPADKDDSFSYDNQQPNGPDSWGKMYPMCDGNMQSPVNIKTRDVIKDRALSRLKLNNYDEPITKASLNNDGHTVNLVPEDGVVRSFQINGTTYTLQSMHWHWGASEHTVNDKDYTMEFHLVHTNDQGNIAVIGVFYQSAWFDNGGMNPIIKALPQVKYRNSTTQLEQDVYLSQLVDNGCTYYRYNGSLTSPPCSQGVIWTICKDPKNIQNSKVRKFKEIYSTETDIEGCEITHNYRPIQPLNGRIIRSPPFFDIFGGI